MERLPKLVTDVESLKNQLIELTRRYERETKELKDLLNERHQENIRRLDKVIVNQTALTRSVDQVSGGVVVVRNIMHGVWLIVGAVGSFLLQKLWRR